ncbi:MAG TPA: YqhA family protein [Ktedonobacteraceae bacterium]
MHVLRNILASSRYLIIISVVGTLVGSIIVLGYGAITVVVVLIHIFFVRNLFTTDDVKVVAVPSVELIDLFLLSTILYIVSLGLYKLFIDSKLPLPDWLEIADLNDLKERILGVILVLLAISFLGYVVEWQFGDYSILALGVAVGLVLIAPGYLLSAGALNPKLVETNKRNDENKVVDSQD